MYVCMYVLALNYKYVYMCINEYKKVTVEKKIHATKINMNYGYVYGFKNIDIDIYVPACSNPPSLIS